MQTVDVFLFAGQSNMAGRGIPCKRFPETAPAVLPGAGWEYRAVSAPGQLFPITEPFGIHENNPNGISDGLNYVEDYEDVDVYKRVFQMIFEALGQSQHYKMMTGKRVKS